MSINNAQKNIISVFLLARKIEFNFVKLTISINGRINTDKVLLFKNVCFIIFYHNNKFVLNKGFSHIAS